MGAYRKDQPRLNVKFLNSDNNKLLFEVNNRDHMNVGEIFTDTYVTSLINQTIERENLPDNVIVLVTAEFRKS